MTPPTTASSTDAGSRQRPSTRRAGSFEKLSSLTGRSCWPVRESDPHLPSSELTLTRGNGPAPASAVRRLSAASACASCSNLARRSGSPCQESAALRSRPRGRAPERVSDAPPGRVRSCPLTCATAARSRPSRSRRGCYSRVTRPHTADTRDSAAGRARRDRRPPPSVQRRQ